MLLSCSAGAHEHDRVADSRPRRWASLPPLLFLGFPDHHATMSSNAWPELTQSNGYNSMHASSNSNMSDVGSDAAFIDPSMFAPDVNALANNAQYRMQHSAMRNNPYQLSSMVPSKRSREESSGPSLSRSQTPAQQAAQPQGQFGFQGAQHGASASMQAPSAYSHLHQGGSANPTPSPTLSNQQFRSTPTPQRVQTVSPAQNPTMPQMTHMNYLQGSAMPPNHGQTMGGQYAMPNMPMGPGMQSRQQQQEAQRQMHMRTQQQQHAAALGAQARLPASMLGAGPHPPNFPINRPGAGMPGMPPSQAQVQAQNRNHLDAFLKNVHVLMSQLAQPFNPQPLISGRLVNLQNLYLAVAKYKGSKYVTASSGWLHIAQMIGFPPQQFPNAGEELRMIYEQNLGPYESAYFAKQQQQHKMMNPQQPPLNAMAMGGPHPFPPHMSPPRSLATVAPSVQAQQAQHAHQHQLYLQQLQRSQAMHQHQMEQSAQAKPNASLPNANGFGTPQPDEKGPPAMEQHRESVGRMSETSPPQAPLPSPTPAPSERAKDDARPPSANGTSKLPDDLPVDQEEFQKPYRRSLHNCHGGLDLEPFVRANPHPFDKKPDHKDVDTYLRSDDLARVKSSVPEIDEMGVIDIRALTMSLQSGIQSEVTLALDALVRVTRDNRITRDQRIKEGIELNKCEDLLDVLVDLAEELLIALAEACDEVSEAVDLMPYEEVFRNSHAELRSLQDCPEFGTTEYDLDRKADRLVAVTTILRNLSFFEFNHPLLVGPRTVNLVSSAIRLMGTRASLLRKFVNTGEFMKDVIILLSNTGDKIELASCDDAFHILHFLVAFAPLPRPSVPVRFSPYSPGIHRYLPPAVDSLAKLLAGDETNRLFCKQAFYAEAESEPPYDLLTRTFGLAVSVVPEHSFSHIPTSLQLYLMQGMLAADILASLVPGPETGVAQSWLEAEDGWANMLLQFSIRVPSRDDKRLANQHRTQAQAYYEPSVRDFHLIMKHGLSLLRRLGERTKARFGRESASPQPADDGSASDEDSDREPDLNDAAVAPGLGNKWRIKMDVLPKKEVLLGALVTPDHEAKALRQLSSLANLDDS